MTLPTDQIWAYLHDELTPDEKERFEQALHSDLHLREALDARRETHLDLESILSLLDKEDAIADDQLEKELLAEWETEHPEYAEPPIRKPYRKSLFFSLSLAVAATAAAATILLLALPWHPEPIHWQRTAYGTAPQLRGQPGAEPRHTRAELKQINRELRAAIETHLEQLAEPPEPWVLKIHLQELANGALAVEISGNSRNKPGLSRVWNERFQGLETFREYIPKLGKKVADDLAEQGGQ